MRKNGCSCCKSRVSEKKLIAKNDQPHPPLPSHLLHGHHADFSIPQVLASYHYIFIIIIIISGFAHLIPLLIQGTAARA
jgi:hypothetical protein